MVEWCHKAKFWLRFQLHPVFDCSCYPNHWMNLLKIWCVKGYLSWNTAHANYLPPGIPQNWQWLWSRHLAVWPYRAIVYRRGRLRCSGQNSHTLSSGMRASCLVVIQLFGRSSFCFCLGRCCRSLGNRICDEACRLCCWLHYRSQMADRLEHFFTVGCCCLCLFALDRCAIQLNTGHHYRRNRKPKIGYTATNENNTKLKILLMLSYVWYSRMFAPRRQ